NRNLSPGAFQEQPVEEVPVPKSEERSSKVRIDIPIPPAPYLDRKVRDVPQLTELWSYINPYMLFGRHLGYKGNFEKNLAQGDPKAIDLNNLVNDLKKRAAPLIKVKA